jgi:hypothetical protein
MADLHARYIGDGIQRPRGQPAKFDSKIAKPGACHV